MNFDTAFDRLMGNEGGYVNNPVDPGGETNWGITWPKLREAIGHGVVAPGTTIKDLTREQAKVIYLELFWKRAQLDQIDQAIAFQVFDIAVNSGIETALRILQRALGVADDGHIGPITMVAAATRPVQRTLMLLVAERLDFMRKLSHWHDFGSGWAGRCATDLRYAAQDV